MDEVRLSSFLESLERPRPHLLDTMRDEAQEAQVPIIRPETEALLLFFVELMKPERILEVGCAVGYSASAMALKRPSVRIDTMENYEKRIPAARANFERAGITDRVTLYEGDATEILKSLEGPYDMIFMDAAKAQYIRWLDDCVRLLRPGGLLISDNVLSGGDILEARTTVERRNRTIHKRMREYLYELKHRSGLETSVIPVGDGVALTYKKEQI